MGVILCLVGGGREGSLFCKNRQTNGGGVTHEPVPAFGVDSPPVHRETPRPNIRGELFTSSGLVDRFPV